MESYEKTHNRQLNVCSRCGVQGHFAFEHATGTMEPFGKDRVVVDFTQINDVSTDMSNDALYVNIKSALKAMEDYRGTVSVKSPGPDNRPISYKPRRLVCIRNKDFDWYWEDACCSECGRMWPDVGVTWRVI